MIVKLVSKVIVRVLAAAKLPQRRWQKKLSKVLLLKKQLMW